MNQVPFDIGRRSTTIDVAPTSTAAPPNSFGESRSFGSLFSRYQDSSRPSAQALGDQVADDRSEAAPSKPSSSAGNDRLRNDSAIEDERIENQSDDDLAVENDETDENDVVADEDRSTSVAETFDASVPVEHDDDSDDDASEIVAAAAGAPSVETTIAVVGAQVEETSLAVDTPIDADSTSDAQLSSVVETSASENVALPDDGKITTTEESTEAAQGELSLSGELSTTETDVEADVEAAEPNATDESSDAARKTPAKERGDPVANTNTNEAAVNQESPAESKKLDDGGEKVEKKQPAAHHVVASDKPEKASADIVENSTKDPNSIDPALGAAVDPKDRPKTKSRDHADAKSTRASAKSVNAGQGSKHPPSAAPSAQVASPVEAATSAGAEAESAESLDSAATSDVARIDGARPARTEGGESRPAASLRLQRALSRVGAEGANDSTADPQVDRTRFVERVARAFHTAVRRGDEQIRMRLNPPELGALQLEVGVKGGVMVARLEAETTAARTLLLENLPALRERLAQQNVQVERFDVDLMNQNREGQTHGQPDEQHDRRRQASSIGARRSDAASPEEPSRVAPRAIGGAGKLDVVI